MPLKQCVMKTSVRIFTVWRSCIVLCRPIFLDRCGGFIYYMLPYGKLTHLKQREKGYNILYHPTIETHLDKRRRTQ